MIPHAALPFAPPGPAHDLLAVALADGASTAKQVRETIAQRRIPALGSRFTPHCTTSLGFAAFGRGPETTSDLLRRAGQPIDHSEACGRNRCIGAS